MAWSFLKHELRLRISHFFRICCLCLIGMTAFLTLPGYAQTQSGGWRVLPIRSQEEFTLGAIGGEAEQHPHSIARSLSNPSIIYLSHDVSGLWRSTDTGETWDKALDRNLWTANGQSIEVDPANPNIVFLTVDNGWNYFAPNEEGLYRSLDGGDNWERVIQTATNFDSGLHRVYRHNIAYDLGSIANGKAQRWYAAFINNGLYRSDDGGTTFTEVSSLVGHSTVYAVQAHPTDGQHVYVATNQGLFASSSQGTNLQPLGNLPAGAVSSIAIHPRLPEIMYVTVNNDGLYLSSDAGQSFSLLRSFDASRVFLNPGYPDTIYLVGNSSNTIISHDGGHTWIEDMVTVPAPGLGRDASGWKGSIAGAVTGIVPNPEDPNEAVAFSRATLWKTTDGGRTFRDSSTLFTGFAWAWWNGAAAFDRFNPQRFALFNFDVGMALTTTGGDHFEVRNSNAWNWLQAGLVGWMSNHSGDFQSLENSQVMVASIGQTFNLQLKSSTNEGRDWTLLTDAANKNNTVDRHLFIAFHPNDSNFVYAGDKISTDAGKTFTHINFGSFSSLNPTLVGMCDKQADTVYAVSGNGNAILRSDDRGNTWKSYGAISWTVQPFDGLPTFAVDPVDPNKIYTLNSSRDLAIFDGSTWTSTGVLALAGGQEIGNFVRSVTIDPNYPEIVYAGMFSSGVPNIWRSTDGGSTWQDISENLPRTGISAMRVNPHTGEFFKGSCIGTWIYPPPAGFQYNHTPFIYEKSVPRPVKTTSFTPGECAERPGAVTLAAPSGSISNRYPIYSWAHNSCADWYQLEVLNSSGGIVAEQWFEATAKCSNGLCSVPSEIELPNDAYTWQIRAWNVFGETSSTPQTFNVNESGNTAALNYGNTGTVIDKNKTSIWHSIVFSGNFGGAPVFVADLQTNWGGEPAELRMQNLTGTGVEIKIEEDKSLDNENNHLAEDAGYLAVAPGVLYNSAGEAIGEAGSVQAKTSSDSDWAPLTFQRGYAKPVVRMQIATFGGAAPVHVRLRNVNAGGLEFQLEEWDHDDQFHGWETVNYVVVEAGDHALPNNIRLVADTVNISADGSGLFTKVLFSPVFAAAPVVLSQSQTYNDPAAIVTRQRDILANRVKIRLVEEEAADQIHGSETVGYLAIGTPDAGTPVSPGTSPDGIPGNSPDEPQIPTVPPDGIPTVTPVPEPSTVGLLLLGAFGLAAVRRKLYKAAGRK